MKTKTEFIPSRLKELRTMNNLTMKEIGEIIGTSDSRVANIEMEKATLPIQNAIRLAQHFNVSLNYIYYLDEAGDMNLFKHYSYEDLKFCEKFIMEILAERDKRQKGITDEY